MHATGVIIAVPISCSHVVFQMLVVITNVRRSMIRGLQKGPAVAVVSQHSSLKCDRYLDMVESPSAVSIFVYMDLASHVQINEFGGRVFRLCSFFQDCLGVFNVGGHVGCEVLESRQVEMAADKLPHWLMMGRNGTGFLSLWILGVPQKTGILLECWR